VGDLRREVGQRLTRALPRRRRTIGQPPSPDQIVGSVGQRDFVELQAQGVADLIPMLHSAIGGGGVVIRLPRGVGCAEGGVDRREAAKSVRAGGGADPPRDRALVGQDTLALYLRLGVAPGEGEPTRQRSAMAGSPNVSCRAVKRSWSATVRVSKNPIPAASSVSPRRIAQVVQRNDPRAQLIYATSRVSAASWARSAASSR